MSFQRMSGYEVGKMRQRITIQSKTDAADAAGQPTRTWSNTYINEPAQVEYTGGTETFRGRQLEAGIQAVFTVRHRDEYTPEMRISYGGNYYGIVRVRPVQGGRRYTELYCRAVVNGEL